jgi:hypothetical protein
MDRSWLTRLAIMVAALLQVLAAPLSAVADASLEREASRFGAPVMHAESTDSVQCPRVHPTDCAFCQAVASLDAPVRPACPLPAATTVSHRTPTTEAGSANSARFSRARPRAPPAA